MKRKISNVTMDLTSLKSLAEASERFSAVELDGNTLKCRAQDVESEAWYQLTTLDGQLMVMLITPDRWLSESIEADLMHTGDSLEELIEDELVELGSSPREDTTMVVQHFRSEDLQYTFQTPLSSDSEEETILRWLLAYEAAFHELGDMGGEEED
jgi:hypothetical protein